MTLSFRGLWTRLIFVFALAATALAQSPVSDDTFVTSASPSSTNGSSPSLVVQTPAGWTFIKLDLSRIPAGTQASAVSKATLKLYVTAATAQGAFDVFRVDTTWKEGTLTYSNSTAPNQSAQALVLTPITTGTCSGTAVQCVTTTSKYVIVDVTSIVKDWLNFQNGVGGSHANNGIAFRPSSGSSISATFESKESTTTGHDSDLEIDYSTSLASIPGTIGPSQVAAGTYAINISGTAATASQFDHITNQCAANLFSTGITTGGNANCSRGAVDCIRSGQGIPIRARLGRARFLVVMPNLRSVELHPKLLDGIRWVIGRDFSSRRWSAASTPHVYSICGICCHRPSRPSARCPDKDIGRG